MKLLPCLFTIAALCALPGCSRSQVAYSRDDDHGYVMDYPAVGADVGPLIEDILARENDPALNGYATNGKVIFHVTSAKVIEASDLAPSPNGTGTTIIFHGHMRVTWPNGQSLEFDDVDELGGFWANGRIRNVMLDAVYSSARMNLSIGPPELTILDPSIVETTKQKIASARNRSDMLLAITDICSAEYLLAHLQHHDLVKQTYDFSYWQQAHQIAMEHADQVLAGSGDLPPGIIQAPVAAPVASTPAPQQVSSGPRIIERYQLFVARGVTFDIPITDPKWVVYKPSLFTPRFNQAEWSQLAATRPRIEVEEHLYQALSASLKTAQRLAHQKNAPYEMKLAQAGYVAQQPNATPEQQRAYQEISRYSDSELGPSTRYLMALKILVDAVGDDLKAQRK